MYSYSIILLRMLGKRGMGQLSTLEVAIIIGFGSAVGDPMLNADVPIFYGMLSVTVVAFFQIGLERLINRNKKVEAVMEGEPRLMVDNGIIQWQCMLSENLSKEDLFRFLRDKEVEHLGQVHKAFFEISGGVSVMYYAEDKVRPGLTVLPESSIPARAIKKGEAVAGKGGHYSCMNCGYTIRLKGGQRFSTCRVCNTSEWLTSVH